MDFTHFDNIVEKWSSSSQEEQITLLQVKRWVLPFTIFIKLKSVPGSWWNSQQNSFSFLWLCLLCRSLCDWSIEHDIIKYFKIMVCLIFTVWKTTTQKTIFCTRLNKCMVVQQCYQMVIPWYFVIYYDTKWLPSSCRHVNFCSDFVVGYIFF